MSKEKFFVEATVNVPLGKGVKPRNRRAVSDWLRERFYHHDSDWTIQRDNSVVARIQQELELDLSQAVGGTLSEQLTSIHRQASQVLANSLNVSTEDIWQLDLLISGTDTQESQ
jgi:hypothetical protein